MTIRSIATLIRSQAAARPDHPALTCSGRTHTFEELHQRSSRAAHALRAEGVGPGDRVAFLDKSGVEHLDVLLGGAKLGAVNVPVNWRLAAREIALVVNDAQAKVLFVGQELAPALDAIEPELTTVKTVVVIGDHEDYPSYADWVAPYPTDDPGGHHEPDDVALQLYTSGTTGRPKGVMLTPRNVAAAIPALVSAAGLEDDSVILAPMPLFHIAGTGFAVAGLLSGAHLVTMRDVDPGQMLVLMTSMGVTHLGAVPAVIQALLASPDIAQMRFPDLCCVVYGASPISSDVLRRAVEAFRCGFLQLYGLTETTGIVSLLRPEDHDPGETHARRLRSAGRPAPGVEVRIMDADHAPVARGEVGEIWSRAEQNMMGYWNQPEETARTITPDGWLRTGDAGYLDDEGFLHIHDRVKDMIVSGGENVYPAEVEDVLMDHAAIADVAVIGVPSQRWGEAVKAVVVAAPGREPDPEEIISFSRERLAHYKCPTSVDVIEALPRNPTGKVLKRELRARYWSGMERGVS